MRNLSSMLAWKYLWFKTKDRNISFMIKVCFLGIFIGTFSLMLTLIITNGFEKTICEKMQNINSQVVIYAPGQQLDYHSIADVLEKEFHQDLRGISGNMIKQAILDRNKTQNVIFLKGIDPKNEYKVTNICDKITWPLPIKKVNKKQNHKFLEKLLHDNHIIIGYKTAQQFNLKLKDKIKLLIPEPSGRKKISLRKKEVVIAGIFKIGLEEYDSNFAFTSLNFLQDLFDEEGIDNLTLKLRNDSNRTFSSLWKKHNNSLNFSFIKTALSLCLYRVIHVFYKHDIEKEIIQKLKKRLPKLQVQSWKDLYPALVSSLKLEKYVMFFILALIVLVAGLNMISLLFMQIQQKRRDIAIYKAMGLSDNKIQGIFLRIGITITFFASILGLGLAAVIGYLLERYPFIQLPDVYYVSHLPARLDLDIFIVVFAATMLLGFLSTWIPSQRAKRINVASVLRQE